MSATSGLPQANPAMNATAARILELMKKAGKKKNPGWTAEGLQPVLDEMNKPGKIIDWRQPRF